MHSGDLYECNFTNNRDDQQYKEMLDIINFDRHQRQVLWQLGEIDLYWRTGQGKFCGSCRFRQSWSMNVTQDRKGRGHLLWIIQAKNKGSEYSRGHLKNIKNMKNIWLIRKTRMNRYTAAVMLQWYRNSLPIFQMGLWKTTIYEFQLSFTHKNPFNFISSCFITNYRGPRHHI